MKGVIVRFSRTILQGVEIKYFFYFQICKHVWYSCCSNSDISNYLIVDLEWAVAVVRAAHVVEPPEHDGFDSVMVLSLDQIRLANLFSVQPLLPWLPQSKPIT